MPVDVLVGLQYGSEGKGKIAAHLAHEYDASVRVGAYQAGHTIHYNGKEYKMQTIPCQWINPECKIIIGAGGFIKLDILEREIKWIEDAGLDIRDRLFIDNRVTIGKIAHAQKELQEGMGDKIGSTQEGIGACLIEKIERKGQAIQAKDVESLQPYVCDTIKLIDALLSQGQNIFIEGTQGCHLSVVTSNHYPKCTSRDCNVSGILADCGISPVHVRNIIGVMRVYPIRVAGNSGDTGNAEISWETVGSRSLSRNNITERTTVTKNVRRVFEFSNDDVQEAIIINRPNIVALMFVDHINAFDYGKYGYGTLSQLSRNWIKTKEIELGIHVSLMSTGKGPDNIVDIRTKD
jgi:adenylosuccinate synthase